MKTLRTKIDSRFIARKYRQGRDSNGQYCNHRLHHSYMKLYLTNYINFGHTLPILSCDYYGEKMWFLQVFSSQETGQIYRAGNNNTSSSDSESNEYVSDLLHAFFLFFFFCFANHSQFLITGSPDFLFIFQKKSSKH